MLAQAELQDVFVEDDPQLIVLTSKFNAIWTSLQLSKLLSHEHQELAQSQFQHKADIKIANLVCNQYYL